jgi:hypothetical protein
LYHIASLLLEGIEPSEFKVHLLQLKPKFKQNNLFDCGIFTLNAVKLLALGFAPGVIDRQARQDQGFEEYSNKLHDVISINPTRARLEIGKMDGVSENYGRERSNCMLFMGDIRLMLRFVST